MGKHLGGVRYMSIKIYTYSNPYEIDCEHYWDEIRDAVQFCVSQTMVNGMYQTYPHWNERKQLATIRTLTNAMYSDWDSINVKVRQIMEVDSAINALTIEHPGASNIKRSLLFNTKSIAESIRILCELGVNSMELTKENLNLDQQYLIDIYRAIGQRPSTAFSFSHVENENIINDAIRSALKSKNKESKLEEIDFNTVVIHGIHQFTPGMLCAIEDISRWKNVILLFNYQSQYQAVYETWLSIYSMFEKKIVTNSENQFVPMPLFVNSYASNLLGDYVGKISDGNFSDYNSSLDDLEVIEFENITEFANYAANIFEAAKSTRAKSNSEKPTLAFMREQMYSASNKVNDILRAYFPEQFGERHFLDYPIGHFFVATTNMWDSETETVVVLNFSDVRECLGAGIISESKPGVLLSTFDKTLSYFEKEDTLDGIISKLKNLTKYVNIENAEKARIGYFNVSKESLKELISALIELKEIISSFFKDFSAGGDNFQRFYTRIQKFIVNRVSNLSDLDDEMKTVIQKLLERINNSNLPDTGTFTCLRQTMSFYLSQDDNINRGAQWIVRGFEQIDGDILRSKDQDPNKICYHFCCLSDKDICSDKNAKLPWPLDIQFFEYAHAATEQKYRIFVKSKMEYHNFNRYAMLYGLVFNRLSCKLSYVKSEDGKENDLYHLIALLGIKVKKYKSYENSNFSPRLEYHADNPNSLEDKIKGLTHMDQLKARICPYRFVLESFVQEKTEYRDQFLIHTYLRILLGNRVILEKSGDAFDESKLRSLIVQLYQEYSDKFKLTDEIEKTKLIASVYKDIKTYSVKNKRYKNLSEEDKKLLRLKEDFLLIDLRKVEDGSISDIKAFLESGRYRCNHSAFCKYCASKDICMEHNYNQEE